MSYQVPVCPAPVVTKIVLVAAFGEAWVQPHGRLVRVVEQVVDGAAAVGPRDVPGIGGRPKAGAVVVAQVEGALLVDDGLVGLVDAPGRVHQVFGVGERLLGVCAGVAEGAADVVKEGQGGGQGQEEQEEELVQGHLGGGRQPDGMT